MKKLLTLIAAILIAGSIYAGGLVTNTNHSGLYTRLLSRNASTLIDAVYYNPAGLTKLGNGIYFSLNNQLVWQNRSVLNNYTSLTGTPKEYEGKISAPFFPAIYAAANFGRLSVSAGFNPIGGGGGAKYETGLPSFEMPISDLVPSLISQGIPTTQYAADIFFEGTSVYMGYQVNLVYKLNDMISVGAGVRLVTAKNTYNGSLLNISVNPNFPTFGSQFNGTMVKATTFFNAGAAFFNTLPAQATGAATQLLPIISGG
jgi:long-subunit fatty acid transport protein